MYWYGKGPLFTIRCICLHKTLSLVTNIVYIRKLVASKDVSFGPQSVQVIKDKMWQGAIQFHIYHTLPYICLSCYLLYQHWLISSKQQIGFRQPSPSPPLPAPARPLLLPALANYRIPLTQCLLVILTKLLVDQSSFIAIKMKKPLGGVVYSA